jgi:hypothetical protein
MKKITLTEEIKKIKRLYNFKKGDTMLSEQRHENKTYLDVKNHLNSTLPGANACEIQKFLEKNGFLEKDEYQYCKFADSSAKALGKYIESKLGTPGFIDLGIRTLQDLQDYMKLIGFDTGSTGFGSIMANKVSELINLLENLKENILNSKEFFDLIKLMINGVLLFTDNKELDTIDNTKKDSVMFCDIKIKQKLKLHNLKVNDLDRKTIDISGYVSGDLSLKLCDPVMYSDSQYMKYKFNCKVEYDINIKNGKLCLNLNFVSGVVNSKGQALKLDYTWWTVYVQDNKVYLNKGKFLGFNVGEDCVHYIDLERELGNKVGSVCIPLESIIKMLSGGISVSDISNTIEVIKPKKTKWLRNLCPPKPKKKAPEGFGDPKYIGGDPGFFAGSKI